jgi:phosphoadenosine phosphosulfate reductase
VTTVELRLPRVRRRPERLEAIAKDAAERLAEADTSEIVAWAAAEFGRSLAVASSMQDTVLTHVVSRQAPGVDVLFLDTGYHFAETLGTRDAVAATMPVRVVNVQPDLTVAEQDARYGARLHERDATACCRMRKVEPLNRALAGYEAWVTGVRREESPTRANTPVVAWDAKHGLVKVNPIAAWTSDEVAEYSARHGVLSNPLLQDGYPSIGCEPCTRRVAPGEDARAGRWAGSDKTECGIHGGGDYSI